MRTCSRLGAVRQLTECLCVSSACYLQNRGPLYLISYPKSSIQFKLLIKVITQVRRLLISRALCACFAAVGAGLEALVLCCSGKPSLRPPTPISVDTTVNAGTLPPSNNASCSFTHICPLEAAKKYEEAFKLYEDLHEKCGENGWSVIKVLGKGESGEARLMRTPCGLTVAAKRPLQKSSSSGTPVHQSQHIEARAVYGLQ